MSTRRTFLKQFASAVGALSCGAGQAGAQNAEPRTSLRLLILGGTGAIGPYHVRAAVDRGHRVAVFSRGRTAASLPQTVERLVGDRNGDMSAIAYRDWDAVLDVATFGPVWVRSLADVLGDRVRHYTFISTVSVYDNPRSNGVTTEAAPVLEYTGREDPYAVVTHVGEQYGALKVLCEREAEKRFPGRTLVLRPGYIGGPGDSRALTYWAARAEKGGELLAGGDPSAPVQYIDVRDMAEWAIRLMEQRVTGVFNAVGPVMPASVGQIVETAVATLSPRSKVTWVPAAWLVSQPDPQLWGTLLFWSHSIGDIMRMSNERAIASGLATRPISETLRDALAWYKGQGSEQSGKLITGFKRQPDGTWRQATSTWSEYLARERELLAKWRSTPAASDDSCAPRREYDEIVAAVTAGFYDKTFRGLDWPARVAHHRKSLPCAADAEQVALVVNRLLGELKSSHLGVYTRKDFHYWGLNSLFSPDNTQARLNLAGIWPERRGGQWFAKYVFEGSPAERAGLAAGDELIRLNDSAFDPFAFTGGADSVVVASRRGEQRTVAVQAEYKSVMQAFVDAARASSKVIDAGAKRVGYFHLWGAREGVLAALNESLAGFERARVDALILDFRGGYGGTSIDYLGALLDSEYLMSVPTFFLIDDGVRSGKEMLAAIVKRDRLGTLVGSRTAGAFLGATPVRFFDNKYFLLLAAFRGSLPDTLPRIEGVGVLPDIEVPACRRYCGGRDPQLLKALDLASRTPRAPGATDEEPP